MGGLGPGTASCRAVAVLGLASTHCWVRPLPGASTSPLGQSCTLGSLVTEPGVLELVFGLLVGEAGAQGVLGLVSTYWWLRPVLGLMPAHWWMEPDPRVSGCGVLRLMLMHWCSGPGPGLPGVWGWVRVAVCSGSLKAACLLVAETVKCQWAGLSPGANPVSDRIPNDICQLQCPCGRQCSPKWLLPLSMSPGWTPIAVPLWEALKIWPRLIANSHFCPEFWSVWDIVCAL